jgi:hypothetical protein
VLVVLVVLIAVIAVIAVIMVRDWEAVELAAAEDIMTGTWIGIGIGIGIGTWIGVRPDPYLTRIQAKKWVPG